MRACQVEIRWRRHRRRRCRYFGTKLKRQATIARTKLDDCNRDVDVTLAAAATVAITTFGCVFIYLFISFESHCCHYTFNVAVFVVAAAAC